MVASLQFEFTTKIVNKLKEIQNKNKFDYLYYSGGCALNIRTNTALSESNIFKNIFIPPCCDDTGLSIGAAAFFEWHKNRNPIKVHSPFLNNYKIEHNEFSYSKKTIIELSKLLLQNKIIGICNGFGEVGPRGLGNRSIIALPFSKELKNKISMRMKGREWYRPLAPIMLEKNAKAITGLKKISVAAKYMLYEFKILNSYQQKLEGIIHINGTARIQILFDAKESPFMYDLLSYLDKKHSVPCLINTSFNKCNEPIVQTSEDAIKSANDLGIEYLIINGKIKRL
ncbi:MAG: hypothetical protein NUV44_04560 [Candidatus Scalindua sp.]|nr:hypothetical protein [Candidatus Scalindua sp.]